MHSFVYLEADGAIVSYRRGQADAARLADHHCHDFYELLYVVEGTGTYVLEGAEYPLEEGTLMLVRPCRYHCIKLHDGVSYERFVLQFPRTALSSEATVFLEQLDADDAPDGRFYPSRFIPSSVRAAIDRLLTVEQLPEGHRAAYVRILLSEIVLLLSTVPSENAARNDERLGVRVLRYLNEHLEEELRLDDVARRFFVSKYHLCRAFKEHNGTSVHAYLTGKRVLRAKHLIEGGEPASSAAYRVGFGDYSAFYRAYVKVTGAAPTASAKEREKGGESL